jgi:hypothetical protein
MTLPAGSVDNDKVAAGAKVDASKLQQQHAIGYAQDGGSTVIDDTRVAHVVYGASGTVLAFQAGVITPPTGDAVISVDLKKNGTSILTAAITIDSGNTARELVEAVIDTATLAADDVLEIVVDETAGTGTQGQGVFAALVVREDAA